MLTLSVDLRTGSGPWQWCEQGEGCWTRGEDRIRPLANPALEARAVTDGTTTLFVVRERAAGRASLLRSTAPVRVDGAVYARAVEECRQWPLQSVWIETGPDGIRLQTGLGEVCPLYLAHDKGTLSGSWQLMDLRAHQAPGKLDEKEVMRLLTGHPRYGHDTLFTSIKRLSERSAAYADAEGLRLVYPAAAEHAQPSELSEGTDGPALVGAFEALVDHIYARRPLTPTQLSGGKDSTNLAISLALAHPGLITPCALLIGGEAGPQQVARRRMVIENTGFAPDITVPAADHPPLAPGGLRRAHPEAVSPLDEPHLEAADALAQALMARGITTVVAGFGGDEVARVRRPDGGPSRTPEAPAWCGERVRDLLGEVNTGISPVTVAPETALVALEVTTPLLARRGLWTIAPFTDPDLVRFGQRLPLEWKRDKRLLTERFAARTLPDAVVHPVMRENFGHLMNRAVHAYSSDLLRSWGKDLHLVEQGFLDAAVLTEAVERAALSPDEAAPYRTGLFLITAVELALRAL
ncbi:asparagine synthase-related protein [Streptomyces chartreusis]|uniref:asparagine synthase-related protein n=1 Tax=Streptomyces chartreusis TaxID=1969 RepID=UPI002E18ED9C|nr:asparagine synthase-related protein [Streptomyces chartreusis]